MRRVFRPAGSVAVAAVLLVIVALFALGVQQAANAQREESIRLAEESIRRGAVTCYAIEGRFPESYEYLRDHYGVAVDEEQYLISYSVFASNLMPDISVIER